MSEARDYREVLDRVKFRDWKFWTGDHLVGSTRYTYLQVEFDAPDSTPADQGGESTTHRGRKWILSEHMTDGEIVQTALMAVVAAMEHEVREEFTYRGHAIFGPHYDLEVLVAVCETKHNDVRRAPQPIEDIEPKDPYRRDAGPRPINPFTRMGDER